MSALASVAVPAAQDMLFAALPTTSVISISCVMVDGRADAVTLIGREGVTGVEAFLGGDSAPRRAVVLIDGWCRRIKREVLDQECGRVGSMRNVLLRYVQLFITQVAHTSVCNRQNSIDQQLCRWLLMVLDRQSSNDIALTQERIAELMGIRRESVTEAAQKLLIAGSIHYHRGQITVVDRNALKTSSCECYEAAKREADRLPGVPHRHTVSTNAQSGAIRYRIGRSQPATTPALHTFA